MAGGASWQLPTAALLCALACVALVAGEVMTGHHDLFEDANGVLLLGPLGLVDLDYWVPPCCCLGALFLLLKRRSSGGEARGSGSKVSAEQYDDSSYRQSSKVTLPIRNRRSEGRQLAETSEGKNNRGCFMLSDLLGPACGFVEDWLSPADDNTELSREVEEPDAFTSAFGSSGSQQKPVPAEEAAFRELRGRLSDLLGPAGTKSCSSSLVSAKAIDTINRFGGERSCLYRFLKAKGLRVSEAEKKLRKTVEWRESVSAFHIQEDPKAEQIFEMMKPHWPEKYIGVSTQGCPITYFNLARAVQTCQLDIWTEANVQSFYVSWMERILQLQREGRSSHGPLGSGNNMPPSVVVYNLKDLKLMHILKCVGGLKSFVKILGIIEEHYPENLHKAIIINVPFVFYKGIWPMVEQTLDASTLSNIHLSDGDGRELLAEVLKIDMYEVDRMLKGVLRDDLTFDL